MVERRRRARVGRPRIETERLRRNRVVVLLTDAELKRLEEIAQGAGLGTVLYGMVSRRLRPN